MPLLTDLLATNTSNITSNTAAVASAGGMALLTTATLSNTTTNSYTLTSGYHSYLVVIDSFIPTANANLNLKIKSSSNNPPFRYAGTYVEDNSSTIYSHRSTNNGNGIQLTPYTIASTSTNADFTGWSGAFHIFGAHNTSMTYVNYKGFYKHDGNSGMSVDGAGRANTAQVTDIVDISFNVNTLSGSVAVYGIKE